MSKSNLFKPFWTLSLIQVVQKNLRGLDKQELILKKALNLDY